MLKELASKPAKMKKYNKHNVPRQRKSGESTKTCRRCGRTGGHISKYGLDLCRHCFREIALELGFKKFS